MIKYRVWEIISDTKKLNFGIIEGNNKVDIAIKLNKLKHKYNLELGKIKLEYISGLEVDNQENL